MAEPAVVPLRSDLEFAAGSREAVVDAWANGIVQAGINVRYGAEVTAISGQRPSITLTLADGETITAQNVVLAIGLQGNPRRLGVPGEDSGFVQYTLDDPEACRGETKPDRRCR